MKIISGRRGGQYVKVPKTIKVRPTTGKSKEGIFNVLNNSFDFKNLKVLDLFSGTGNISYEFESRGANVTSVDNNINTFKFLKKESNELKLDIYVLKSDVYNYLKKANQSYDIIYADPPYNFSKSEYLNIINIIFNKNLLKSDGLFLLEHSNQNDFLDQDNFYKIKKYGGCFFSFFKNLNC
jgi:16S rRNA (guanine(966)-N(2))-methyltransferase RsmD